MRLTDCVIWFTKRVICMVLEEKKIAHGQKKIEKRPQAGNQDGLIN